MSDPPCQCHSRHHAGDPTACDHQHGSEAAATKSPPLADPKGELRRITDRLMAIMANHVESARRMNLTFEAAHLRQVINALQAEASNADPQPLLDSGGELVSYVKQSLYDELLGEPSNVFMTTRVNQDTIRYEPMPREFWQKCLTILQEKIKVIEA